MRSTSCARQLRAHSSHAAHDASQWLREFTEAVFENFAIRAEFSEPFHLFI